jgi:carbonic anhydrase/acetyltransferase-like protein (isoleucine patch superfamily)
MIIEHRGKRPHIDPRAVVSPAAHILGDVEIGRGTVVLAGSVIVAEGAPVRIGAECVLMEHSVVRGAGVHACDIGDAVLIGPHTHVSGATVEPECFIATGAAIFNAAHLGRGSTVAVHGVVHICSRCAPGTFVPVGHVAFGDPVVIYPPERAPQFHQELFALGFTRHVFGFDSRQMSSADATREVCRRYARSLAQHGADREVDA